MKYTLTLATIDCSPPCTATVEVEADTKKKAVSQALDLDFEELEWNDDLGNPVDWNELDSPSVAIAEE